MTATDALMKKHFKVKDFASVLKQIDKKEKSFFKDTLFLDKDTYLDNFQILAREINSLSDAYKMAQEASKSGSIIQGLASSGLGSIQKEYIQKRKAMIHHVSLFVKKK